MTLTLPRRFLPFLFALAVSIALALSACQLLRENPHSFGAAFTALFAIVLALVALWWALRQARYMLRPPRPAHPPSCRRVAHPAPAPGGYSGTQARRRDPYLQLARQRNDPSRHPAPAACMLQRRQRQNAPRPGSGGSARRPPRSATAVACGSRPPLAAVPLPMAIRA